MLSVYESRRIVNPCVQFFIHLLYGFPYTTDRNVCILYRSPCTAHRDAVGIDVLPRSANADFPDGDNLNGRFSDRRTVKNAE